MAPFQIQTSGHLWQVDMLAKDVLETSYKRN